MNFTLLTLKLIALFSIFALSFIFGIGSFKLGPRFENSNWLSIFSMFSAGIFLSVAFLDLLPEAQSEIYNQQQILSCLTNIEGTSNIDTIKNCLPKKPYPYNFLITMLTTLIFLFLNKSNSNKHTHKVQNFPVAQTVIDQLDTTLTSFDPITPVEIENKQQNTRLVMTWEYSSLILMLAIIIHAIFEAVAIGIVNDWAPLLDIIIAVLLHKWAEASIFGIFLHKYNFTPGLSKILLILFICTGPVGIISGYYLMEASNIFNAIVLSICAGIFLYMSLVDIVSEEMEDHKNIAYKIISFLLGVALNVIVSVFN